MPQSQTSERNEAKQAVTYPRQKVLEVSNKRGATPVLLWPLPLLLAPVVVARNKERDRNSNQDHRERPLLARRHWCGRGAHSSKVVTGSGLRKAIGGSMPGMPELAWTAFASLAPASCTGTTCPLNEAAH